MLKGKYFEKLKMIFTKHSFGRKFWKAKEDNLSAVVWKVKIVEWISWVLNVKLKNLNYD